MKYMIMTFGGQDELAARSPEWIERMIEQMIAVDGELDRSGELIAQQGLADPSVALTVTVERGAPVTTSRPYAEARASLAGFWIVDVEKEERAVQIAARISAATEAPVEVRRCADVPEGPEDASGA